jgi:predicted amidophosphoribosyltransferase
MAPRTTDEPPSLDACVGCDQVVAQRDDLGLCPACAAKLDRDMIRDRDWERSWTAWHTPADQRNALRATVVARYGARYELLAPPAPTRRRRKRS